MITQATHPSGQIVVNPRVEGFTKFEHPPIMNREVTLSLVIPGDIADESMDVEIGIVGSTGFMLEQGGDHLTGRLGDLFIGEISPPVSHFDLLFKPAQFLFHGGIKLDLHAIIDRSDDTYDFGRTVGELDILDLRNPAAPRCLSEATGQLRNLRRVRLQTTPLPPPA